MFLKVLLGGGDEPDGSKLVPVTSKSAQSRETVIRRDYIPTLLETRDNGTNQPTLHNG